MDAQKFPDGIDSLIIGYNGASVAGQQLREAKGPECI